MASYLQPPASADDLLKSLRPGHPRLMMRGEAGWEQLRQKRLHDAELDGLLVRIETYSRGLLDEPTLERVVVGRRLLDTSREALQRITALAIAYQVSGDKAFAARAEAEMLAVCAFADWNPSHFLDVAEMALGVSLGYDWLYDQLAESTRQTVRAALQDKALRHAVEPLKEGGDLPVWMRSSNNWNPVCLAGLTAAALAVAEDDPAAALVLLPAVAEYNPRAISVFAPDGVHPEGPTYWSYGTTFQVLLMDVLDSALHTDMGLGSVPGFAPSPDYFTQMIGPTRLPFNYSDASARPIRQQVMLWFARQREDAGLASGYFDLMGGQTDRVRRFDTFAPLWWVGRSPDDTPDLPLAWHGGGEQSVVVFRQAWGDPDALWLAAKAGSAKLNHAHMDAGSFVLEADGQRWAEDLGMQDYHSLESKGVSLFNMAQDSGRWDVFRLNNRSHNTLTINDKLHRVEGVAEIEAFDGSAGQWRAAIDLSPVYEGLADRVVRTFRVDPESGVAIRDEVAGLERQSIVRWVMVSRAEIELSDDARTAVLRQNGKSLEASLQLPAEARFEVHPADPPKPHINAPNPGHWILSVSMPAKESGQVESLVWLGRPGTTMPAGWLP